MVNSLQTFISVVFILMRFVGNTATVGINVTEQHRNNSAQETQHAFCQIMTEEIKATANATITRELKGVCTSHELTSLVSELETKIMLELATIKAFLLNVYNNGINEEKTPSIPQVSTKTLKVTVGEEKSSRNLPEIIANLNDTIRGGLYVYFWKIENVLTVLAKYDVYISSPEFFVFGHPLHVQLYPHHLGTESIGLQLRTPKGYAKKYKLTIMDFSEEETNDLESEILGGVLATSAPSMFNIKTDQLRSSKFISNNCLIVKIEIILDS